MTSDTERLAQPRRRTAEQTNCEHANASLPSRTIHTVDGEEVILETGTCDECGQRVAHIWESKGIEEVSERASQNAIVNDFRDQLSPAFE